MKKINTTLTCLNSNRIVIVAVFVLLILAGCNKIAYLPKVTHTVTVTANSATISFQVDRGDGDRTPQVEYSRDADLNSSIFVKAYTRGDHYEVILDSLERNTTYYYRFIVSNSAGGYIIIANADSFTTTAQVPASVSTSEVFNFVWDGAYYTAIGGGKVIDDGNSVVSKRGVCWGTERNPTIEGNHADAGSGTGAFTVSITNLMEGTKYYVRAFAVNSLGISYGNEVSFMTGHYWANGVLPGLFSISEGVQVKFSQGNLQYQASTDTWRFAETQHEKIGENNTKISNSYSGWIDLFGWGTSGFEHGANCYQPWSVSIYYADYYAYGKLVNNLCDETGQADWGYNAISNGGNENNQWRTLSSSEWSYILSGRNTLSGIRYIKATIFEVYGIVLFPDAWEESYYTFNNVNGGGSYDSNIIDPSQWLVLEQQGAVFLPVSGSRHGSSFGDEDRGAYWSTTHHNTDKAYGMTFTNGSNPMRSNFNRERGLAVRLVKMVE